VSREEATAMDVRGGAPVGLGGDGRAEELRDVEKKLARGWVGARKSGGGGSAWRWLDGEQRRC